jgi:hypothetical protein
MNLLPETIAISHQIRTFTELRQQIHDDLRIQNPEWSGQMANARRVILTKRASWNCSTL